MKVFLSRKMDEIARADRTPHGRRRAGYSILSIATHRAGFRVG